MDKELLQKLVNQHCEQLMEHFDSVQIFVTEHVASENSTRSYETGRGNFYSRLGQIQEWVVMQVQFQKNESIRRDNSE